MLPGNDTRGGVSPLRPMFNGTTSYVVEAMSPVATDLHPVIHAGRVALITGAACGIGQAAAREFAKSVPFAFSNLHLRAERLWRCFRLGLKIAIADISKEKLAKIGKELAAVVGEANVMAIPTDVSKLEEVVRLRDRVYEAWGEVRIK